MRRERRSREPGASPGPLEHPPVSLLTPSYGMVDGQPLFLDLLSDSYFLLDTENSEDGPEAADQADLAGEGQQPSDLTGAHAVTAPPVTGSVLDLPERRASMWLFLELWRQLRGARRDLASKPLTELVAPFAQVRCASPSRSPGCIELARSVASARTLVPQPRHCLTDSLALMRILARHEHCATLVFGAKLDPFAAHCWVQSGDVLLNENLEVVQRFTPVLTLPR